MPILKTDAAFFLLALDDTNLAKLLWQTSIAVGAYDAIVTDEINKEYQNLTESDLLTIRKRRYFPINSFINKLQITNINSSTSSSVTRTASENGAKTVTQVSDGITINIRGSSNERISAAAIRLLERLLNLCQKPVSEKIPRISFFGRGYAIPHAQVTGVTKYDDINTSIIALSVNLQSYPLAAVADLTNEGLKPEILPKGPADINLGGL